MRPRRMIPFTCPYCREPMEVSDKMEGRKVECVECGELVRVPLAVAPDEGLTAQEGVLFGVMFAVLPVACVLVSSILYYVWKAEQPRRANQINGLGFIIFFVHIVLAVLYFVLIADETR